MKKAEIISELTKLKMELNMNTDELSEYKGFAMTEDFANTYKLNLVNDTLIHVLG